MRFLLSLLFISVSVFASANAPIVVLKTNQGTIELTLRPDVAPLAVESFIGLVKKGYYDGIVFHRIIPGFMIQGGDPTGTGRGGASLWNKPFKDEFAPNVVFDKAGILAMANAGPFTNGSQFFITVAPTHWLNGKHTIFGFVSKGMDVVRKLELAPTNGRYGGYQPVDKQQIIKASVKKVN